MNNYTINSFYTKTNIFKFKHIFWLKNICTLSKNNTTNIINTLLNQKESYNLPFLIKINFLKTVRSTIPTISYQYILPQQRQFKSNSYNLRLVKNHSTKKFSLENIYSTILKI